MATKKTNPSTEEVDKTVSPEGEEGTSNDESPTGETPAGKPREGFLPDGRKIKPAPTDAEVTASERSDKDRMKAYLDSCEKINFYIPLAPGEKKGQAYESVNLNGYRMEIKKGMQVQIPVPVAERLADFLNIDSIGEQYRLDADAKRQEALG